MNWNQEELEQWALAEKQKDDDQLAVERYRRADEIKVKELTMQLEKSQKQVLDKKAELEREVFFFLLFVHRRHSHSSV